MIRIQKNENNKFSRLIEVWATKLFISREFQKNRLHQTTINTNIKN